MPLLIGIARWPPGGGGRRCRNAAAGNARGGGETGRASAPSKCIRCQGWTETAPAEGGGTGECPSGARSEGAERGGEWGVHSRSAVARVTLKRASVGRGRTAEIFQQISLSFHLPNADGGPPPRTPVTIGTATLPAITAPFFRNPRDIDRTRSRALIPDRAADLEKNRQRGREKRAIIVVHKVPKNPEVPEKSMEKIKAET